MLVHIVLAVMAMAFILLLVGIRDRNPMMTFLASAFWIITSVTTYNIDFPAEVTPTDIANNITANQTYYTVEVWQGNIQLLFYALAIISFIISLALMLDIGWWMKDQK